MASSDTRSATETRLPPEKSGQVAARETLPLEQLVTDAGTPIREALDDDTIGEYADALQDGARFPPVVVFRSNGTTVLADGFHRVQAYRKAGRTEIEADVHQGGQEEALWFALGANRTHGQRLRRNDKRRAIEIAYEAWPDLSQRRIAKQVGCTQPYVGQVRAQLKSSFQLPDRVVGKDGRKRPATRPPRTRRIETTDDEPNAPPSHELTSADRPDPEAQEKTGATIPKDAAEFAPADPEPTAATPTSESATEPSAAEPSQRRSRPGVTASQSARDRSNRIVSVVADNAKNLTAQEDLIDFTALDRRELPKWIEDLEEARLLLGRFLKRLKEVANGPPASPAAD